MSERTGVSLSVCVCMGVCVCCGPLAFSPWTSTTFFAPHCLISVMMPAKQGGSHLRHRRRWTLVVVLVVGAARHRPERDEAERSPCVPFTFGIGVGRERQVLNLHAHRNHLLANLDLLLPGNHLINVTNSNTPPQKKKRWCVC